MLPTRSSEEPYFPRAPYAAFANSPLQKVVLAASRLGPLGRRYHEHFAMLAERTVIPSWDHHYIEPR